MLMIRKYKLGSLIYKFQYYYLAYTHEVNLIFESLIKCKISNCLLVLLGKLSELGGISGSICILYWEAGHWKRMCSILDNPTAK